MCVHTTGLASSVKKTATQSVISGREQACKLPHVAAVEVCGHSMLTYCCLWFTDAGTVVTYSFTVRNDGNTKLQALQLQAPAGVLTDILCNSNPLPVDLAVGASSSCSAQHELTQQELEAGSVDFNVTFSSANGLEGTSIALATVTTTASASMSATVDTTVCTKPDKARK